MIYDNIKSAFLDWAMEHNKNAQDFNAFECAWAWWNEFEKRLPMKIKVKRWFEFLRK